MLNIFAIINLSAILSWHMCISIQIIYLVDIGLDWGKAILACQTILTFYLENF